LFNQTVEKSAEHGGVGFDDALFGKIDFGDDMRLDGAGRPGRRAATRQRGDAVAE